MSMIENNTSINTNDTLIRPEFRPLVGDNKLNELSRGQKFLRAIGGFFKGVFGVAGKILSVIPGPWSKLGSVISYGISNLATSGLNRMDAKRAQEAKLDAQSQRMTDAYFSTPGFGNGLAGNQQSPSPSMFQWSPFAKGHETQIINTLNSKNSATEQKLNQI